MFEFGSFAMKGLCSGFVGFGIGFAVAAAPEYCGRDVAPPLTIGSAPAVAAAASAAAMTKAKAAQSRAGRELTRRTFSLLRGGRHGN